MDNDSVAMLRTAHKSLQDQQVKRALEYVRIAFTHEP